MAAATTTTSIIKTLPFSHQTLRLFSKWRPIPPRPVPCTLTQYPEQYDMIVYTRAPPRPTRTRVSRRGPQDEEGTSFEDWVNEKLTRNNSEETIAEKEKVKAMDMKTRKYYYKRQKRMYGGDDSEDERRKIDEKNEVVELIPHVVEFSSFEEREEELYFYDAFLMPWEKNKHYKMVYQLEKKFFPDYAFDKAFFKPGEKPPRALGPRAKEKEEEEEDKSVVFFDDEKKEEKYDGVMEDLSVKKVEEFFKGLSKVEGVGVGVPGVDVPFLSSRRNGLPPKWDCPAGTAVLVNKPKGWTSFTVCGKLRRLTNVKKVGHAGTLDPMATGLLIVCVGKATKVVDRYQGMTKGYSGTFRLGEATSTWDADSPVIHREPWEHIKDRDIKKAAASFMGEIWQVPPMFSAIKVGGEKMYDKARRGESIELSPRRISILQFDVERSLEDRQNLVFRVTCSKGTYIRSLCADLGKALGSCAHLTSLRRDFIGDYTADDAFEFHELEELIPKSYI